MVKFPLEFVKEALRLFTLYKDYDRDTLLRCPAYDSYNLTVHYCRKYDCSNCRLQDHKRGYMHLLFLKDISTLNDALIEKQKQENS